MNRPPLREAHAHIAPYGRSMSMLDASRCASIPELLDALHRHASTLDPDAWSLGHGLRVEGLRERRWPTQQELLHASGGRQCILWLFDHHALVATETPLKLANIDASSADPEGGLVERDASGEPTGVVYEKAAKLVWSMVPEPSPEQIRRDIVLALEKFASMGFVEVHDLLTQPDALGALLDLHESGELDRIGVDIRLFAPIDDLRTILARFGDRLDRAATAGRLRLAGAKLFSDGTLNGRTALMLADYADPIPEHPRGMAVASTRRIYESIRTADAIGLPLATHAIGDGAVRAVLDAIEEVRPETPGFRIEHAELIDGADIPRFARLGVVCSVQPCHLLTDIEVLRRLLPSRLHRVLPLADLLDSGLEPGRSLLFGSDAPIVRPDPEDSIAAATLRRRPGSPASEAIAPAQAIDEATAWACFVRG